MSAQDARRAREHAQAERTPTRELMASMRWEGAPPEELMTPRELFAAFGSDVSRLLLERAGAQRRST